MTFGCLLMPVFIAGAALWIFGPIWGWIPFMALFGFIILTTICLTPARLKAEAPITTQSFSALLAFVMLLTIPIGIGVIVRGMYWELSLCAAIYLVSALTWPSLHVIGKFPE